MESVILGAGTDAVSEREVSAVFRGEPVRIVLESPVDAAGQQRLRSELTSLESLNDLATVRVELPSPDAELEPQVETYRLRRMLSNGELEAMLARVRQRFPQARIAVVPPSPGLLG